MSTCRTFRAASVRPGDGSVIIRSYTEIMNKEKMITEPSPGHNGNVVLGQGNITLQGRIVKIKNSTTVPLGTSLTIEE